MDGILTSEQGARDRARRNFRTRFIAGYFLSYTIDTILLGLFVTAGTIPLLIPVAYFATGSMIAAVFGSLMYFGIGERSKDPYLTAFQTFASGACMLLFLALAPELGFLFLATLFIVFGFGSLRMSWREALLSFGLIAGGTGFVLHYTSGGLPHSTSFERLLVWIAFVAILARLIALGLLGSSFRVRVVKTNQRLKTLTSDLENRTAALVQAQAVADAANRALLESERQRSEQALRESDERFRQLAETMADAVLVGQDGKNVYANPAAARLLGAARPEQLLGGDLSAIVEPARQEWARDQVQRALAGEMLPLIEDRLVRLDGSSVSAEIAASRSMWQGRPAVEFVIRDVTERKFADAERARLEAQLRESQKMEALGTLAGGVAHDFNNALAIVVGNLELARQDIGPDHPALESLKEIEKANRRAKDLVQQILAFGRRQKFDRKPTSLSLVVLESARLLRASLPASVRLEVECEGDTPAVLADATQVSQILLNLCSNALHAVQELARPGVIEVRLAAHTQPDRRGELGPGHYACLTVRDNGSGMDDATRARVFEPFFTTKPTGKGTGLGLSVVHGIVQAHEATITVESTPGEGSTFRIFFPAIDAQVPAETVPAPGAAPVSDQVKHILCVDDEEGLIRLMERVLVRAGFRFTGYTSPREALEAVRANPEQFDLVVTDYQMPDLSGLDVVNALMAIRPDLPVVLASGYITDELREKALAAGVRELINKPNTVDELCGAVARVAGSCS